MLLASLICAAIVSVSGLDVEIVSPGVVLDDTPFTLEIAVHCNSTPTLNYTFLQWDQTGTVLLMAGWIQRGNGTLSDLKMVQDLFLSGTGTQVFSLILEDSVERYNYTAEVFMTYAKARVIPGLLSILPPVASVVLAFVTKKAIVSLFLGVWLGRSALNPEAPPWSAPTIQLQASLLFCRTIMPPPLRIPLMPVLS